MEIINLIFSGENMRTIVTLAGVYYFIRALKFDMKEDMNAFKAEIREDMNAFKSEVIKTIDEKLTAFHVLLKDNDFAHLNRTIKALTFTLEKNKILEPEDKKYIDSHLDEK